MPSKEKNADVSRYYVENLLFNHEIEILSQFVKDLSFEKKRGHRFFY